MKHQKEKLPDGEIIRDGASGRVLCVTTEKVTSRASKTSVEVVAKTSDKHRDALKRLVNR